MLVIESFQTNFTIGPSVIVSFFICGVISAMTALVYAEFSGRMPFSGSGYQYIYCSFGELPAWIIGWNMNLRYGVTAGALIRGWSQYVVGLFAKIGITLPVWLYSLNVFGYDTSIITVLYVILCTYIVTLGSKESNVFNYVFTVAKLGTLLLISVMALTYMNVDNYTPFVLEEKGGWSGTIQGASVIYFAFLGFDFITCLAEETRNPIKDLPRSIMMTINSCTLLYCLISGSMSGMAKLANFNP